MKVKLVALFLFMLIASGAKTQVNLQSGLVAYYPFNGNANDESGNGNNGTVNGATLTTDRFGNAGKAYSFDGTNSVVEVMDNSFLNLHRAEFTISFWVNLKTKGNTAAFIGQSNGAGYQSKWILSYNSSYPNQIGYYIHSNEDPNTVQWIGWNWNPELNTPIYLTFKRIGDVYSFYENGILINSTTSTTVLPDCNTNLAIGALIDGWSRGWYHNGSIDDIRIYNRALSSDEITQLYNSEKPATDLTTGLVAYYPFNGNANDESGNGNNGTVNGATLTTDRFGNLGKAYSFDGVNDYVEIPYKRSLLPDNDSKTYNFWIKFNESNSQNIFSFGNGDADYSGGQFRFDLNSNGTFLLILHSYWGYGGPYVADYMYEKMTNFNPYIYHLVTAKVDQRNVYYYLDGNLIASKVWNLGYLPFNSNFNISIGRIYNSACGGYCSDCYFNGTLDEVRIYNKALSTEEIQALYEDNSELPNNPNFKANTQNIGSGGSVTFTNTSSGFTTNAKYFWSFGDGAISHDKSPTHTYSATGNYNVKLTVVDLQKKYVKYEKEYIHVGLGYIKGTVKDSNTGQGLPYSLVFLYNDGRPVQMTKTDIAGNYILYPKQYSNFSLRFKSAGYRDFFEPSSGVYVFGPTSPQHTLNVSMINTTITDCKITNLISYTDNTAHIMEKGTAYFYFSVKDKANDVPVVNSVINAHFSNTTNQKDTLFTTDSKGILKVELNLNKLSFTPNNLKLTTINGAAISVQPTVNIAVDPVWGYEKQWQVKNKVDIGADVLVAGIGINIGNENKVILSKTKNQTSDPDYISFPSRYNVGGNVSIGPSFGAGISMSAGDNNGDIGVRGSLSASLGLGLALNTLHEYPYATVDNSAFNMEQTVLSYDFLGLYGEPTPKLMSLVQFIETLTGQEKIYETNFKESCGAITLSSGASGSFKGGVAYGSENNFAGEAVKIAGDVNVNLELYLKNYFSQNMYSYGASVSGEISGDINLANFSSMGFKKGGSFKSTFEILKDKSSNTKAILIDNEIFSDPARTYGLALYSQNSTDPTKYELNYSITGSPESLDNILKLLSTKPFGYIADNLMNAYKKGMPKDKNSSNFMAVDRQGFSSFQEELINEVKHNPNLKIEYEIKSYDEIKTLFSFEGTFKVFADLGAEYEIEESNKHLVEKGQIINGDTRVLERYSTNDFKYFNNTLGQTLLRSADNLYEQNKSSFIKRINTTTNTLNAVSDKVGSAVVKFVVDASNKVENIVTEHWTWETNNRAWVSNKRMMQRMVQFRNDVQDKSNLKIGIGGFYTFSPYKQVLNNTSTLKIYYTDSEIAGLDENNLGIYKWIQDQNKWVYHGGVVNVDSNYVIAPLDTLYTYTIAPCIPVSKIILHPSVKTVPANGSSVINFVSNSIYLNNKSLISNNYLFTVSTTNGTFTTADADTTKAGIQIRPVNGVLNFGIKSSEIGDSVLVNVESVQGSVKGDTIVVFTDTTAPAAPTGLTLARLTSGLLLQWNKNPEIDVAGYIAYVDTTGNKDYKTFNIGSSVKYMLPIIFDDSVSVSLKAYDYAKNYSELSAPVYISENLSAPNILSYTPVNNVDSCALVSIKFDKAINLNSLNDSTIFIYSKQKSKLVTGNYQLNENTNEFSFTPDSTLTQNDTIYVTATSEIKDVSGNSLNQNVVWSFIIGKKDISTDVNKGTKLQSFRLYPNPSTGIVNIETKGDNFSENHIEVVNIQGQVVYTFKLPKMSNYQIDLSSLHKGTYLFRLFENKQINAGKIILE